MNELVLYAIAGSMLAVMFYVIYEVEKWKSDRRVLTAIYIEGMMLTMNLGAYLYVAYHCLFYFLVINGAYAFLGLYSILLTKHVNKNVIFSLFSAFMVISEFFMGSLFVSLETGRPATFNSSINNVWFVTVMLTEMSFTLFLSFRKLDKTTRNYLISLLLLMPWFPALFSSVVIPFWASAIIMIGSTILIYETLYNQRLRANQETFTTMELMSIFMLMMLGEFLYFIYSTLTVFDASMIIAMAWFVFRSLVGPNPLKGNYLRSSKVAFGIIFLTFVMEFFMGGALDFIEGVFSPGVSGFLSSLSLPWLSPYSVQGALWDFIDIVGSVLGSTWFLIMMGVEMGFLAFKKMMEMHVREVRIRMALMMLAYAIYSIYLPTFSPISSIAQYIPYMWSMGIGTMAPVSNAVLVGLIGTYVVYAVLSFLFGSRNLCAVSCTAPLMYQGNFYDSLKVYNRTSRLGRKTLTSRLAPWYRAIALGVSLFVLGTAIVSYLNSEGIIHFTVYSVDITILIYFIWFDIMWYLLFISIPFLGTFACVTTGYCYWGVFNQAVSRIGLFRLKVKDPQKCLNCKTVDCASACPVGLTDMRASFIKKGEFRSMKCVGLGECVNACPYDNITFYDVRHWIRNKFHRASNKS
ncbi:4Fe-4S binding protein [Acidianus sp. HS-5]|uniref:4Fe-4S binding protein n=1 Tax=Acidianus sp. HS-5 TaxID=2886040 RepID=UPI001F2897CC|nr:4Fe-4S binding protein [Acidianus sp. HS-5]BDC17909.1 4Fe-4S ferredoxin [Acidianus sp. HS-5]